MRKFLNVCAVVLVNLAVLVGLLGGIELYYRHKHPAAASPLEEHNGLWQVFRPYVMFTTAPGPYRRWHNDLTNETYSSTVRPNSLGFNDTHEFSLTDRYVREPGERVVLFTSGSVGWGFGATATDKTTAGRMQYYLNTLQHDVKYTVINMSMGSWIAIQELIGLQLWGPSFDPDWVVVMDGFNDAGVGCGMSQGVPTKLGAAREITAFYLRAQESMLNVFPAAAYILSTQPTVNDFAGDFVDVYQSPSDSDEHRRALAKRESDLEFYLTVHENEQCGAKTYAPSYAYIYVNGALRLERLVDAKRRVGRKVEYHNTGTLLPNKRADRIPYFIDSAHLSDKGADVLGRFYAERILAADRHPEGPSANQRRTTVSSP